MVGGLLVGDLIKYAKRWAIMNMVTRGALVAAVAVPLVVAVCSGGGSFSITWSIGQ